MYTKNNNHQYVVKCIHFYSTMFYNNKFTWQVSNLGQFFIFHFSRINLSLVVTFNSNIKLNVFAFIDRFFQFVCPSKSMLLFFSFNSFYQMQFPNVFTIFHQIWKKNGCTKAKWTFNNAVRTWKSTNPV